MLKKILWNNVFLPQKIKEQLIIKYSNPSTEELRGNSFLLNTFNLLMNKILLNKNIVNIGFKDQKDKKSNRLNKPLIFSVLEDKELGVTKLEKLFSWGFKKDFLNKRSNNLIHEVLFLYEKRELSFISACNFLNCLLKNGVVLFNSNINSSISSYEKGLNLKELTIDKEFKDFINEDHDLIKKVNDINKIIQYSDEKMLNFILSNPYISIEEKALLEYINLKENIYKIQSHSYIIGDKNNYFSLVYKVQKIIDRGNLFHKQNHIYHALRYLFSLDNIDEIISNRSLLNCYEQFSKLNIVARRSLANQLINKKKETIIFNLLSQGLNLNWSIKNREGKENILALEILDSMPMIKMILSSDGFNICISNVYGENILHLLGDLPLLDDSIVKLLEGKINNLNNKEKEYLFNQVNDKGLTPLLKAIYLQEETMIEFLLNFGVKIDDSLNGMPEETKTAINFVDKLLLPVARNERYSSWINVNDSSYVFWQNLSKEWNSKKLYLYLNEKINLNKVINNTHKVIKI